ncbi:nuclear transport factor 2 family protein [Qipengyuania flava]|uniref:nuclear transport factor 2 family protein n=1 Tax=Qipengyuania flava TaxID=192812 RepID=UPI003BB21655
MSTPEENKRIVRAFLETVFNQHEIDEGMDAYVGETYTQHNPNVADGVEAFRENFKETFAENPESYFDIKRMFCEGNHVTVHAHWTQNKDDRGSAVMDIFRLEDGRIVEHWDVIQPIPEHIAHDNTMF